VGSLSTFPKVCGCGRTYDVDAWRDLHGAGRMDDGEGGQIDLRHCPCHSTLAVPVAELEEDDRLAFEVKRFEKIARFLAAANAATDLALRYSAEDRRAGYDARQDHRIIAAVRQTNDYLRAASRLREMAFNGGDVVLVATMHEELRSAAE